MCKTQDKWCFKGWSISDRNTLCASLWGCLAAGVSGWPWAGRMGAGPPQSWGRVLDSVSVSGHYPAAGKLASPSHPLQHQRAGQGYNRASVLGSFSTKWAPAALWRGLCLTTIPLKNVAVLLTAPACQPLPSEEEMVAVVALEWGVRGGGVSAHGDTAAPFLLTAPAAHPAAPRVCTPPTTQRLIFQFNLTS